MQIEYGYNNKSVRLNQARLRSLMKTFPNRARNGHITIRTICILPCRYDALCMICTAQIQPRKHVLDHAGYTASTRQHGLVYASYIPDRESICPERSTIGDSKLSSVLGEIRAYLGSPQSQKVPVTFGNSC